MKFIKSIDLIKRLGKTKRKFVGKLYLIKKLDYRTEELIINTLFVGVNTYKDSKDVQKYELINCNTGELSTLCLSYSKDDPLKYPEDCIRQVVES